MSVIGYSNQRCKNTPDMNIPILYVDVIGCKQKQRQFQTVFLNHKTDILDIWYSPQEVLKFLTKYKIDFFEEKCDS